ncbi:hypothetical protein LIS77_05230 [Cytobacillus firmus]|uniref:phosphoribosyltransferase-like protein n=1 Tax=Cytobacillus firmus TaxID=1399 RepID=UPI00207A7481|nr:hypothetical protein [Cytobacillus firmus]USK39931.1 hypothetical protein LIS77_05230 [Cytobacillus firmus]
MGDTEKTYIQEVASSCVARWGTDKKTENFSGKLGRFVSQLRDDRELGDILIELVKHYNYYTRKQIEVILMDIHNTINNVLYLNPQETIYSRIEDDSKIDSSNSLLEEFKIINDISNSFSHDIEKLNIEDFNYITNVVFIDDIIGSGKTVEKFFKKNIKKLSKVNIYIFCIEILEEGKQHLEQYIQNQNLTCIINQFNIHSRAFSNLKIFNSDNYEKEQMLRKFEEGLFGANSKFVMGFENSQAIISFYRNTPNNTLGTFWYSGSKWEGLFPRSKGQPNFMSQRNKKKRKSAVPYNMKRLGLAKDD